MSPGNDERRPGEGRRIVEQTGEVRNNSSRRPGQMPVWRTVPRLDWITARSGRQTWHATWRCCCGQYHRSVLRTLDATVRRTSACGHAVELHITVEAVAA